MRNVDACGINDTVYLGQLADYSVKFVNCNFGGGPNWDVFAAYGNSSNRICFSDCYDCTFEVAVGTVYQGSIVEACDLHGGVHNFHNCIFKAKDGGARTGGGGGGTFGLNANDFFSAGGTNIVNLYDCTFQLSSTNSGVFDVTNYASAPGKSVVNIYGGSANASRMANWNGYLYDTNSAAIVGSGAGLTSLSGANFSKGMPTLTTNATSLVKSATLRGNDNFVELHMLLNSAAQAANSNYFLINLSRAISTNAVIAVAGPLGTNSSFGALGGRWTFYTTSNTVTVTSTAAPVAGFDYGFGIMINAW